MSHDPRLFLCALSLAALTACASPDPGASAPVSDRGADGPFADAGEVVYAEDADAAGSRAVPAAPTPGRTLWPSRQVRAIWQNPSFQDEFMNSYLSDTDVEPSVSGEELAAMQEILERLSADDLDGAANLVENQRGELASALFDFTLANIQVQREQLEAAVESLKIAVGKHPKFRRAWQNLGWLHFRLGQYEQAVPALSKVMQLGGGSAMTYGMLGFSCASLDQTLSAETAFRMAMLLDPATMDWKRGLAQSLFKQSRFGEAVTLCDSLIEAHPDRADLWLLQANAYIGLGQPLRAAENYEFVDRLGQSTGDSLTNLADIYVNEAIYDRAVDCYRRALEVSPQPEVDRPMRAVRVLTANGALPEAKELVHGIETVLDAGLAPEERKELLKLQSRIAVAEGAGDEEARVLQEIVDLDPLDGEALILLGKHHLRRGHLEQAIFDFERAASIEAFEAEAKVSQAQVLVGQGRYDEALPLLRRAQQVRPRDNVQQYLEKIERVAASKS